MLHSGTVQSGGHPDVRPSETYIECMSVNFPQKNQKPRWRIIMAQVYMYLKSHCVVLCVVFCLMYKLTSVKKKREREQQVSGACVVNWRWSGNKTWQLFQTGTLLTQYCKLKPGSTVPSFTCRHETLDCELCSMWRSWTWTCYCWVWACTQFISHFTLQLKPYACKHFTQTFLSTTAGLVIFQEDWQLLLLIRGTNQSITVKAWQFVEHWSEHCT